MAYTIITRKEAMAQGLPRYFTGKPCKRGHVAERYVRNLTCMGCDREKQAQAQWHKVNRDRHNELGRESYQRCKDQRKSYRESWSAANPDYFKARWAALPIEERQARKQEWYEKNREHAVAYTAEWVRQNPEQAKISKEVVSHRRRARIRASEGQFTQADLRAILDDQDHRCAYCQTELTPRNRHLDHIVPLARGGSNDRSNIQFTCKTCNLSKAARDPIEFAQSRGLLI